MPEAFAPPTGEEARDAARWRFLAAHLQPYLDGWIWRGCPGLPPRPVFEDVDWAMAQQVLPMPEPLTCCTSTCTAPVPSESPDHVRLRLCALHAALGCLLSCVVCGETWPEHGPRGHGCATFLGEETAADALQTCDVSDDAFLREMKGRCYAE